MTRLKQAWLALDKGLHFSCSPRIAGDGSRRCMICRRRLKIAKGKKSK